MKLNTELAATILEKHGLTAEAKLMRENILDLSTGKESSLVMRLKNDEGITLCGCVSKAQVDPQPYEMLYYESALFSGRRYYDPGGPREISLTLTFVMAKQDRVFLSR